MSLFDLVSKKISHALRLGSKPTNDAAGVYAISVQHAIYDFSAISYSPGTEEEHRTSMLMGHLSSTISWYNLFSTLSKGEQCRVMMNVQKAKSVPVKRGKNQAPGSVATEFHTVGENVTGGDFGLAVAHKGLKNGEIVEGYRLAFFQAKNAVHDDPSHDLILDINRTVGAYSENQKSANALLANALDDRAVPFQDDAPGHQVYKLISTAWSIAASDSLVPFRLEDAAWVHYAVWQDGCDRPPLYVPLASVLAYLKVHRDAITATPGKKGDRGAGTSGLLNKLRNIPLVEDGATPGETVEYGTFEDLLLNATQEQGAGWMFVTLEDAAAILGPFIEAGFRWYIHEDRHGGGLAARLDNNIAGLSVSADNALLNLVGANFSADEINSMQMSVTKAIASTHKP